MTTLSAGDRERSMQTFERAFGDARAAIAAVPDGAMHFQPAPGAWTIQEIVVHLADSEANAFSRFRFCIAEPGRTVLAYDQDRWTAEMHYSAQDANAALELFGALRGATARLLRMIPAATWANTVEHPEHGTISLDDLLLIYADHIPGHLAQIQRNISAWRAAQPA